MIEKISAYGRAAINKINLLMNEDYERISEIQRLNKTSIDSLTGLIKQYVEPYAIPNPQILIIGFGFRIEEVVAIDSVLHPKKLIATEPSGRGYYGFPKWKKYLNSQAKAEKERLQHLVEVSKQNFEDIEGEFDIVFALTIDKAIQRDQKMADIISKSSNLVVITAHKTGVYPGDHPLTDIEFVDKSIQNQRNIRILRPMERLFLPETTQLTNDGAIWVLKKLI